MACHPRTQIEYSYKLEPHHDDHVKYNYKLHTHSKLQPHAGSHAQGPRSGCTTHAACNHVRQPLDNHIGKELTARKDGGREGGGRVVHRRRGNWAATELLARELAARELAEVELAVMELAARRWSWRRWSCSGGGAAAEAELAVTEMADTELAEAVMPRFTRHKASPRVARTR